MSIRVREFEGETVALCAAKTVAKKGDIYLSDAAHHALTEKFMKDFESMGFMENPPMDEIVRDKMLKAEQKG